MLAGIAAAVGLNTLGTALYRSGGLDKLKAQFNIVGHAINFGRCVSTFALPLRLVPLDTSFQ